MTVRPINSEYDGDLPSERRTIMAQASKKHFGPGTQGKGTGTGANTNMRGGKIAPNMVLSNRDKSQHPKSRGQDSKEVQTEQSQDESE
jgi:hypothetical protein